MKGFSLWELIVVIGLLAGLAVIAPLSFQNLKRTSDLDVAFNLVKDSLIRARTRAQAGEGDSQWGVKLLTNKAVTFSGANYASRTVALDEKFNLPKTIIPYGATEVVFSKLTGVSNVSGDINLSNDYNAGRCFYLDTQGTLLYPSAAGFNRQCALTAVSGEDNFRSAVIDTQNGFAYFGTSTSPGQVVKVRLSDFTRVGAITFNTGEDSLRSAVIDLANGFAYFGTITSPGQVVKVRLSDFIRAGALILNFGENDHRSAVIDQINGFAYFGTYSIPGRVVRINVR